MEIMLASLREERQQTYSCFLPIHPKPGACFMCRSSMSMQGEPHHHL
jgi:hypothetical protein